MHSRFGRALALSLVTLVPALAHAGPPLICFPMAIGEARSLAWGTGAGWNTPSLDYDRARLAEDTVAVLGAQTPILVRMETLRRAVIYASTDSAAAKRLFDALRGRAAQQGSKKADILAQFDLGYAVEAFRQTGPLRKGATAADPTEDGYALVRQALSERGADSEMEYAAALITCDRFLRSLSDKHLQSSLTGLREGSDLARTIAAHRPLWGARLDAYRATAGR